MIEEAGKTEGDQRIALPRCVWEEGCNSHHRTILIITASLQTSLHKTAHELPQNPFIKPLPGFNPESSASKGSCTSRATIGVIIWLWADIASVQICT